MGQTWYATLVAKIPVTPGGSDLCFIWPGHIDSAIAHLRNHDVEIEIGTVQRFGSKGEGIIGRIEMGQDTVKPLFT